MPPLPGERTLCHDLSSARPGLAAEHLIEKDLLLRLLEAHEVRLREEEGETAEQKFGVTIRTGATDLTKSRHRAYGHSAMSGPLLQHLQAAHGDKIKAGVTNGHCNACIETRSHKRGKPTDSHHRRPAEVYLDRVHIDIKVIFGFPYLLVLDEALNLGKAILDTGKDRLVSGVIQHFKTEEIHARRRCRDLEVPGLRQLRMDGAKEFVHGDLEEYLNELGATRELRVAHDPEQSGRIEAFGHTVTSHVGAMLRGGGAPIEMTPFAVEHFTSFVHPRIPGQAKARGLRGEECFNTAYEAYHGVHIDPKVLDAQVHPIFCKVAVHVTPELAKRWSLDPLLKAVSGIFLGKAPEKKGWLVLVIGAMVLINGCSNVVFLEDEYPCKERYVRELLIKHGWADARTYPLDYDAYESEFLDGGAAARKTAGRPRKEDSALTSHNIKLEPPIAQRDMRKGLYPTHKDLVARAKNHVGGPGGPALYVEEEESDAVQAGEAIADTSADDHGAPQGQAATATPNDAAADRLRRVQGIERGTFTPRDLTAGLAAVAGEPDDNDSKDSLFEVEEVLGRERRWSGGGAP